MPAIALQITEPSVPACTTHGIAGLACVGRGMEEAATPADDERSEQTAAETRLMLRTEADGAHGNAAVASQIAELQKQLQSAQAELKSARVEHGVEILELGKRLHSALSQRQCPPRHNHQEKAASNHPKMNVTPRRAKVHLSQCETADAAAAAATPAPGLSRSESADKSALAWLKLTEAAITASEENKVTLMVPNAPSAAPSAPRSINTNVLQRARRAQSARDRVKVG
jgi:hypothetical protein